MEFLTVFAATLLIAVLVSGVAERTILSTAVIFLLAGVASGPLAFGFLRFESQSQFIGLLILLTLFSVLYTDGMRVGIAELRSAWRLPGRALLFGMPLTLLMIALFARVFAHLTTIEALLVGAILSPTDPVFAAALVGREEVPQRLRHLLNVESGLNDGLALPIVVYLLAIASHENFDVWSTSRDVISGIALGCLIPWISILLERLRIFRASVSYRPLNAFAIALLTLTICHSLSANEYLAAFAAGVTVASTDPTLKEAFRQFGELISELLKLAAVLVFGCLIDGDLFRSLSVSDYLFAVGALFIARPVALLLALLGSKLPWRERLVAAWFGPKGFASVAYGILVLKSHMANSERLFHLIALVIAGSIILHSSSDTIVANSLARRTRATDDKPKPA